jgi:hypothetical protein
MCDQGNPSLRVGWCLVPVRPCHARPGQHPF